MADENEAFIPINVPEIRVHNCYMSMTFPNIPKEIAERIRLALYEVLPMGISFYVNFDKAVEEDTPVDYALGVIRELTEEDYEELRKRWETEVGSKDIDEEIDRNARAYGFEIGRGHPLAEKLEKTSPDNPFLDKNWRAKTDG